MTGSGEHRSKYHVRATEDDILSESKKKADMSAISEMKELSCEEITHLLKTAGEGRGALERRGRQRIER